ncbi:hypothetical protein PVL29_002883 [Vitis rotundifolia]|uniref:Uncharacterized protein n=1 Tax=Vitis rotundifolia TaxID=103349 RepID=A0AA39ADP8_VITRO|nr:hypothetical protein PVL29_002883 [Vitis rotundifolia]
MRLLLWRQIWSYWLLGSREMKLKDMFVSPAFKDCILGSPSASVPLYRWDKYMKQYSSGYYRRSCTDALHIWYNDQLWKDIGVNPKRKKGFFAELFQPYGPMDYCLP